ncbi:MAG: 30S ribosomal protein S5 [Candidatus Paceibacterota bacterium]
METTTEKKNTSAPSTKTEAPTSPRTPASPAVSAEKDSARVSRYGDPRTRAHQGGGAPRGGRGNDKRGGRHSGKRGERPKPEFDQKIISIRRVTRVVAGGRRFSFSVALVTGDKNGSVGVGIGKASDTALAIEKAFRDAKQSMITIKRTDNGSIPHDVEAKYTSSQVMLRPSKGKGLVAGSSVRTVLELCGIKDVSGKLLSRSKNKLNNARATLKALEKFGTIARREKSEPRPATSESRPTTNERGSRASVRS